MDGHVYDDRAGVTLGTVVSVNDGGQAQTATVRTMDGGVYADVEVIQMYGFSSRPPADGALALMLAIGGDPANWRAILFHPSWRFGNQADREAVMFGPGGARVAIRDGGVIEIKSASSVTIKADNASIEATGTLSVSAAAMVVVGTGGTALTLQGDLHVTGAIEATGAISTSSTGHFGGGVV